MAFSMLAGNSIHVGENRVSGSVWPMSTYVQIKVNELFLDIYLFRDTSIYLWHDRVGKSEIYCTYFL